MNRCWYRTLLPTAALIAVSSHAAEPIVTIDQEPQHRLKFQNQHVRLFDVLLPPGYKSLWHSHLNDGVFVVVESAESQAQDLGAEPVDRPPRTIGETFFINYGKKHNVHRVNNTGATPYHVTDTEILQSCPGYATAKDAEGQTLILENERVRVTRLMIGPGETMKLHPPCGMLIAVTTAKLSFKGPGAEETVTFDSAGFKWRNQLQPLQFTNVGQEVFHGVDIVLK